MKFYHGSCTDIKGKYLIPHRIDYKIKGNVVFASKYKWYALCYAMGRNVFLTGFVKRGTHRLINAVVISNECKTSYLYTVNRRHFRLGPMTDVEGYSFKKVPIMKKEVIKNPESIIRKHAILVTPKDFIKIVKHNKRDIIKEIVIFDMYETLVEGIDSNNLPKTLKNKQFYGLECTWNDVSRWVHKNYKRVSKNFVIFLGLKKRKSKR